MRSERSKGCSQNLYSTGFAAPASCRLLESLSRACRRDVAPSALAEGVSIRDRALADDMNFHTNVEPLPRLFRGVDGEVERDSQSEAGAVSER